MEVALFLLFYYPFFSCVMDGNYTIIVGRQSFLVQDCDL